MSDISTEFVPKNVEEGVAKFRQGEDYALAHYLQENEYKNHQRFNEDQRHIVQRDIRLARKAQVHEEHEARQRGIVTAAQKAEIMANDALVAESYQQEHIQRYRLRLI